MTEAAIAATTMASCRRCGTSRTASFRCRLRRPRRGRRSSLRHHGDGGGPAGRDAGGDGGDDDGEPGRRNPVWATRTAPLRERQPSCAGSSAFRACWTGRADALLMRPRVVGSRCTTPEETCPPRSSLWPRRLRKQGKQKQKLLMDRRLQSLSWLIRIKIITNVILQAEHTLNICLIYI